MANSERVVAGEEEARDGRKGPFGVQRLKRTEGSTKNVDDARVVAGDNEAGG